MTLEILLLEDIKDATFDSLRQELRSYTDRADRARNKYLNAPWYKPLKRLSLWRELKSWYREADKVWAEIDMLSKGVLI